MKLRYATLMGMITAGYAEINKWSDEPDDPTSALADVTFFKDGGGSARKFALVEQIPADAKEPDVELYPQIA